MWLSRPSVGDATTSPDAKTAPAAPPPDPDHNPYLVSKAVAHFDNLPFAATADFIASSVVDQFARSPELATWVKDKRARAEAGKPVPAPEPPPAAPPRPPPAPPPPPTPPPGSEGH